MREQWASRSGFLLATIGSAVGVGNIWRFPHLVGQNGGGAFILAYLLTLTAVAIPLLILELAIGRRYATSAVGCFIRIGKRYRYPVLVILLMAGGLLSYYLVVIGWGIGFMVRSALNQPLDFNAFISGWEVFAYYTLAAAGVTVVVARGIRGGIERANRWLMPLLAFIVVILAGYGLTLDGRNAGIEFYLKPDLEPLRQISTWSDSVGQAFFSVGVGMGVMITYGSYVSRNTDLHASALWIVFSDLAIALLAGLMIFPMVFTYGLEPASGPDLAFQTLPVAFELLPASQLWGALFFFLFTAAGFSSAISLLEALVAPLVDEWRWQRWHAAALLGTAVFLVGVPSALSYTAVDLRINGDRLLDLMDRNVGTLGLPAAGLISSLVLAWAASKLETIVEIDRVSFLPVGKLVFWLTRYVVPVGLTITLAVTVHSRYW